MNERSMSRQFRPAPSNFGLGDLKRRQERLAHYETMVRAGKMSSEKAVHIVRCGDAAVSIAKHLKRLGLTRTEMVSILWDMVGLLLAHGTMPRGRLGTLKMRAIGGALRAQKLH